MVPHPDRGWLGDSGRGGGIWNCSSSVVPARARQGWPFFLGCVTGIGTVTGERFSGVAANVMMKINKRADALDGRGGKRYSSVAQWQSIRLLTGGL